VQRRRAAVAPDLGTLEGALPRHVRAHCGTGALQGEGAREMMWGREGTARREEAHVERVLLREGQRPGAATCVSVSTHPLYKSFPGQRLTPPAAREGSRPPRYLFPS
jgi:hypothetical protein